MKNRFFDLQQLPKEEAKDEMSSVFKSKYINKHFEKIAHLDKRSQKASYCGRVLFFANRQLF